MPFLITAYDHPNKETEREAVRQAHRDYLASFGKRLLGSGALLDETGTKIVGGASLLDTDDLEEARSFEAEDPYAKAGIRADVKIVPWRLRWWVGTFDKAGHRPSEM
ncbi:YciI family protein [uncultured Roseobacter sp.]|uniref:YciI family protein n=1 Tax=uncultured Roseobacter sp. TaxID=114847 RepID=UPI00262ACABA|nr:YciI family protein [uncultured Roseobacter sp.]